MSKDDNKALYDTDEMSKIFLKALATSAEVFDTAKSYRFKPDDLVSGPAGSKTFKKIADIIYELKATPCDKDLFLMYLNNSCDKGDFDDLDDPEDQLGELYNWIFDGDNKQAEYVQEHMGEFIRRRRLQKVLLENQKDAERAQQEFAKVIDEINTARVAAVARTVDPFATLVKSSRTSGVLTGIGVLDAKTGGLGKGECGLIIGHSGSGKTAVASFMMRQSALNGFKVLYLSAEEPAENIVHRLYAQQFKISYTAMYMGNEEMKKQEEFGKIDAGTKEKLSRIRITDVRDLAPLDEDALKKVIEQEAESGFIPDVVIIDQMDYLKPKRGMPKGAGKWQEYEAISFEMDHLSQYKIQGEHEFALWVVHQATGDMQWVFTYNDIAGFKGIVKPFDLAIGVGREERDSKHVNLFSLKVRHSEHFAAPHRAEFEHMSFYHDATYKPKYQRDKEEKRRSKNQSGKSSKNPTQKRLDVNEDPED